MRKLLLPLLSVALFWSCSEEQDTTMIEFESGASGTYMVSALAGDKVDIIDTLQVEEGTKFGISMDTTTLLNFTSITGNGQAFTIIAGPEKSELVISASGIVSGDEENNWLGLQQEMRQDFWNLVDSIEPYRAYYQDSTTFVGLQVLDSLFYAKIQSYRAGLIKGVTERPGLLSNLMAFYHQVGENYIIGYPQDSVLFEFTIEELEKTYPGHPDVVTMRGFLENYKNAAEFTSAIEEAKLNVAEGKPFPSFTMMDKDGNNTIMSSEFLWDHYVFVWASWCVECRTQLRQLQERTDIDPRKIIFISLDGLPNQRAPKNDWLWAIEDEGWQNSTHLSDLRGQESSAVMSLGITELPLFFRVEKGIITRRSNVLAPVLE